MKNTAEIVAARFDGILRTALGPDVARFLSMPGVTDLMLDANGALWIERNGERTDTECTMGAEDADRALRYISHHCIGSQDIKSPVIHATLPTGERIAATIPPITSAPTFAIRKPAQELFSFDAFSVDPEIRRSVFIAVERRRNILVAGATGSGKTTLVSCLLATPSVAADRLVLIEDTQEIVVTAPDHVRFLTSIDIDTRALVRTALRYRPDRIVLGEVRSGAAALELIHAMNTGHSGSLSTIHANSAEDALGRIEDLCREVCTNPPVQAIARAIQCVIFTKQVAGKRGIAEVIHVDGWDGKKFIARNLV